MTTSDVPDGHWRCERCKCEWTHAPAQTQCPRCHAETNITWLNWPEVEAAVARINTITRRV